MMPFVTAVFKLRACHTAASRWRWIPGNKALRNLTRRAVVTGGAVTVRRRFSRLPGCVRRPVASQGSLYALHLPGETEPRPPLATRHFTGKKMSVRHFDWSVSLPGSVT